jgi:hypothetical protein
MQSRGGQSVELLRCKVRVAAVAIGERKEARHRVCRLVVTGKKL